MYSSIHETLVALYPRLSVGGFVVFDDWKIAQARTEASIEFRLESELELGAQKSTQAWAAILPITASLAAQPDDGGNANAALQLVNATITTAEEQTTNQTAAGRTSACGLCAYVLSYVRYDAPHGGKDSDIKCMHAIRS